MAICFGAVVAGTGTADCTEVLASAWISGNCLTDAGVGWPLTPDGGATPVTAAMAEAVDGLIAIAVPRPVGLNTLAVVPGLLTDGKGWFNFAAETGTTTAVLPPTVMTWPVPGVFPLAVVIVGYPAMLTTFPVLGIATALGFFTTPAKTFALAAESVTGVMAFNCTAVPSFGFIINCCAVMPCVESLGAVIGVMTFAPDLGTVTGTTPMLPLGMALGTDTACICVMLGPCTRTAIGATKIDLST